MTTNKNDLVLDLFNKCCFDIKEMVFNEVDKIKQKDYYKRNNYEKVLNELKHTIQEVKLSDYWCDFSFIRCLYMGNLINNVYGDMSVGCKLNLNRSVVILFDNDYYSDLDFILDCDCNTIIDIDNWDMEHKYKIKDSRKWKYEKNYTLHIDMDYVDNDNFYGLVRVLEFGCGFNLWDWLEENCCSNDIHNDILYDLFDNEFNGIGRNNDKLKHLLYTERLNGFNVFY